MKRLLALGLLLALAGSAFAQDQRAHPASPNFNAPRLGQIQGYRAKYVSKVCSGYTLKYSDSGTQIQCSDSGAATITLPAPMPSDFQVAIEQNGAGAITVSAGSGATLHAAHSFTKTAGQYSIIGISMDVLGTLAAPIYISSGDGA